MSDNSAIAAAMAAKLEAMTPPVRTLPYLSDTFTPPVVLIGWNHIDPHSAFAKQAKTDFKLLLILNRTMDRTAMAQMENFADLSGASSIISALEADQSLGGVIGAIKVVGAGPPAPISIGTPPQPYLGCIFEVSIWHGDA
jgi:hypothetical protein